MKNNRRRSRSAYQQPRRPYQQPARRRPSRRRVPPPVKIRTEFLSWLQSFVSEEADPKPMIDPDPARYTFAGYDRVTGQPLYTKDENEDGALIAPFAAIGWSLLTAVIMLEAPLTLFGLALRVFCGMVFILLWLWVKRSRIEPLMDRQYEIVFEEEEIDQKAQDYFW